MKTSERELLSVIDSIYATALEEKSWADTIKHIAEFLGGCAGAILEVDRDRQCIVHWSAYGLDDGQDEYVAHVNSINPRMRHSLTSPVGQIDYEARFITEREIDRHEFYNWAQRVSGVRYFVGTRARDVGSMSMFTSVEFPSKHGHASKAQIKIYETLTKHVANAWRMRKRLDEVMERDITAFVSESMPWGIVTLDTRGYVLTMNTRAQAILATGDGLGIHRRQLIARRASDGRALQGLIGKAVGASAAASLHSGGAMRIARHSGLPEYVIQILPFVRATRPFDDAPAAIVYISDPADSLLQSPGELMAAFGLSDREALLATELGNGTSLAAAAERMKISRNTARNHLQAVFRKTRTNNQAALVRLLARLIVPSDNRGL